VRLRFRAKLIERTGERRGKVTLIATASGADGQTDSDSMKVRLK
jgi:hypothetical protein